MYTVKMARATLPAMAAGILFRRRNYPRMQATNSAGNDCLWFPQVTCGNLPAPAGNLREAFIVNVRADFLKPRDASYYTVPNTLSEVTFAVFEVNGKPFNIDSVPKKLDCFLFVFQSIIQKIHLNEKFFTIAKMIGKWLLSLLTSLTILE